MVFWYGPVQSNKRLDRAVQSFQQSPKKATDRTRPDRGQSTRDSTTLSLYFTALPTYSTALSPYSTALFRYSTALSWTSQLSLQTP